VSLIVTIRTYAARLSAKSSGSFGGVQIYERPTKASSWLIQSSAPATSVSIV